MKTVFENMFVKFYHFNDKQEFEYFFNNQRINNKIIIDESGDTWYCYMVYDSFTSSKMLVIGFNSDESDKNFQFVKWPSKSLFIIYNGSNLYLVSETHLVKKHKVHTPLMGLSCINSNRFVILEELAIYVLSDSGNCMFEEQIGFIENYYIENNHLIINTNGSTKKIKI